VLLMRLRLLLLRLLPSLHLHTLLLLLLILPRLLLLLILHHLRLQRSSSFREFLSNLSKHHKCLGWCSDS
jgi:hypothetical protein